MRRVRVDHEPMIDVEDCVRYLFKADAKYHDPGNPAECVRLFTKGTPRLPQATGGFFPGTMKKALWNEWKAERCAAEVQAPAVVPRSTPSPRAGSAGDGPARRRSGLLARV